ncbi:Pyruvate kinase isozyme A, partial [Monoraphidium neglectum]
WGPTPQRRWRCCGTWPRAWRPGRARRSLGLWCCTNSGRRLTRGSRRSSARPPPSWLTTWEQPPSWPTRGAATWRRSSRAAGFGCRLQQRLAC